MGLYMTPVTLMMITVWRMSTGTTYPIPALGGGGYILRGCCSVRTLGHVKQQERPCIWLLNRGGAHWGR